MFGHRACGTEVDVVGMGGDDEHSFDLGERQASHQSTPDPPRISTRTPIRQIRQITTDRPNRRRCPGRRKNRARQLGVQGSPIPTVGDMTITPYDHRSTRSISPTWSSGRAPRDFREAAFKDAARHAGTGALRGARHRGLPVPAGRRLLRARPGTTTSGTSAATPSCSARARASNIGDLPQEMNEFFGSMINMDDPKHFRLRSIVSKGFTPKEITGVEGLVVEKAKRDRRPRARAVPRQDVRLRRAHRGGTPARDHLRHDGHPARGLLEDLRVDEHDPRRRRPRVRHVATTT